MGTFYRYLNGKDLLMQRDRNGKTSRDFASVLGESTLEVRRTFQVSARIFPMADVRAETLIKSF